MGRKPNQLILEFFERGEKLNDSSNRYAHTCRACGEKFPKGRTDTLNNHILKGCSVLTEEDRARAFMQMQHPEAFNQAGVGLGGSLKPVPVHELDLPYQPANQLRDLSANQANTFQGLETLAEAAKKASNSAQMHGLPHHNGRNRSLEPGDFLLSDEQLQQQEHLAALDGNSSAAALSLPQSGYLPAVTNIPDYGKIEPGLHLSAADSSMPRIGSNHNLAFAASTANELIPNMSRALEPTVDARTYDRLFPKRARLSASSTAAQAIDPSLQDDEQDQIAQDGSVERQSIYHRPLAMNPDKQFANWNGAQKPERAKHRGRFSDSRRKEVQDVRKQGACVRCRMLKKPCSGGTPCTSCKSVETARLWKQPCIRTKIADELDLFSIGLYSKLSFQEVTQAKGHTAFQPSAFEIISASQLPGTALRRCVDFNAMVGQTTSSDSIDPALLPPSMQPGQEAIKVGILYVDGDDISEKLEHYFQNNHATYFDQEPSAFMSTTLRLASGIYLDNKDPLLYRSLELWSATHALADDDAVWELFWTSNVDSTSEDHEPQRSPIQPDVQPLTHRLVLAQLHAFTEKHAANLVKSLMNDLERRLLARLKTPQFETFLIGIILLNCVEKMCWLFHVWQHHLSTAESQTQGHGQTPEMSHHVIGAWQFPEPPSTFIDKAEGFCDLLVMLLRMRAVVPRIEVNEDGYLRAVTAENFNNWFKEVSVTREFLEQQKEAQGSLVDSRSWELKYISRLLSEDGSSTGATSG